MWIEAVACIAAVVAGVALWYSWFLRYNRQRSLQVLRWLESSLAGHGRVVGVQWTAPSRAQAQLRLAPGVFQRVSAVVQLAPRELPFRWLLSRLRREPELITFQADLDIPPEFNLEVHNHRWCGRTRRHLPRNADTWETERAAPFMLVTRNEWQREISPMVEALLASRDQDFLRVSFQRGSPHLSASLPVDALAPDAPQRAGLFEALRELAGGASASRF
jgi:hypothetical protein